MQKNEPAVSAKAISPGRFDVLRLLLIGMIIYIPNQTLFHFEFPIKGLNVINVLFLVTLYLLGRRDIHAKSSPPLKGPIFFMFAVLTFSFLIGQFYDASVAMDDFTALKTLIFYILLYFLYFRAIQDEKTIRLLFIVMLCVTFVASIQGLRQALDYGIASYNETRRVAAPFGWGVYNANRSAVFFVMYIPLFAVVAMYYRPGWLVRLVSFLIYALGVFVVFFTYSRQSYFILAVLALFLTLKRSFVACILIVVALANYEAWAPETVIGRIQSTEQKEAPTKQVEGAGEGKYDESTESRLVIWAAAGQLIDEHPWGIGLNHFKRQIGTYAPRYANMDAHSNYVLITTEAGYQGALALGVLLIALFFLGWRTERINDSPEAKILGVGYMASVIAVILGNLYGSRFFDGDVMGNFWILTALVARYGSLQKEAQVALLLKSAPSD
jgi:O-antigen ligase